jgi:hypothetical protein
MAKRITYTGQPAISHPAGPQPKLQATGQPLSPYNPSSSPYLVRGTVPVPGMPGPGGPASPYPGVAGWGG